MLLARLGKADLSRWNNHSLGDWLEQEVNHEEARN